MKIEKIEMHHVSIPLKHFFETSFGREDHGEHIIVKLSGDGLHGYGESAVSPDPSYCYETTETVWHVMKDFLIPAVLGREIDGIETLLKSMSKVRGHHFAKCGIEGAYWHLHSLKEGQPLHRIWGGTRTKIQSGVSIGIQDSVEELLERITGFLDQGYKRIKIKIKPGWDVVPVEAVRKKFGDIPLMVDANAAYTLNDSGILQSLDEFDLTMIEQPLHFADLTEHAVLQKQLKTPICLDESISGVRTANAALALGSCKIINIKPGRVGGYVAAREIHDICKIAAIPVWCGGMLEFGIGRALNLAICSLPNFIFPGDVSSSDRYFDEDIITPPVEFTDGELLLSEEPGFGFKPDDNLIEKYSTRSLLFKN